MMRAQGMWRLFCLLAALGSSLCENEVEFDGNFPDNYDNEISEDQQEEDSETPACQADLTRWDKLFIALEDSNMKQNILQESVEQCCGGKLPLINLLDKLSKGTCHQCAPALESACRAQAEQASLKVQHSLAELREEEAEKERRLSATLQMLLQSSQEENARLRRLELTMPPRPASRHQLTPEGSVAYGSGMKPPGLAEQDATPPPDFGSMEDALISIAMDLQRLQLQLNNVIEQAGELRKDRGDT